MILQKLKNNLLKYTLYIVLILISFSSCSSKKKLNGKGKTTHLSQKKENEFASNFIEATTQKIIGNYDLAQKLFLEGLKIKPKSAVTYFELSGIYGYKKMGRDAVESAEKSVQLNPENDWYKTNLAVLYQKYGMYEESLKLYKTLVEKHPGRYEYLFTLADNYLVLNKKEDALTVYSKIQKTMGNSEELALHKQNLYLELNQVDNAILEVENLIKEHPNKASYYGLLAELYDEKGDESKTLYYYDKVLEIDPNNADIRFALYSYYSEKGKDEKAYEELKKGFANPEASIDTKTQILLGFVNVQNKIEQEKGAELAEIMVQAHPKDSKSYTALAEIYLQKEDYEKALTSYKKSVSLESNQFLLWNQIVFIEADLKLYDSLIVDSEKAIDLFPTQPLYYFFSGLGNTQKGNVDRAIKRLNQGKDLVLDNDQMLGEFYQMLGDAYHTKKENEKSDRSYDKALELNPRNLIVLNNYSYYLSEREEELDKALKMSKFSNVISPQNANYLDTYAWILFKQKKYTEASSVLEDALTYGGENSIVILEHYGDVQFFLNNKVTALEYWEKASKKEGASDLLFQKIKEKKYIEEAN